MDSNLPRELQLSGGTLMLDSEVWEQCRAFRLRLGGKGWLAPIYPANLGGGGISQDDEVVLREELEQRGLVRLVEETVSLLRSVDNWENQDQKQSFLTAIARGRVLCWQPFMNPGETLDPGTMGVHAIRDADDFILNGQGLFAGLGPYPDYLWTLALHDPKAAPQEAFAAFLVPTGLEGITVQTPRRLWPGVVHQVNFDQVRVPPYCLLGNETEGWPLAHSTVLAQPAAASPRQQDSQVASLLDYARNTPHQGGSLGSEPARQQLLMEAYINSRIHWLFRTRDSWMRSTGRTLTYHAAQTNLWEVRSTQRLSEIAREVMGMYALLDREDPRAPAGGSFELQQRKSLALHDANGAMDGHAGVIARALGLGHRKQDTRPEPAGRASPTAR